jgi:hypothetical protein
MGKEILQEKSGFCRVVDVIVRVWIVVCTKAFVMIKVNIPIVPIKKY